MRVKKLIKRGERRSAYQKQYYPVWHKWKQSIGDHFAADGDILADGVGYRCEDTLHKLFNGSYYDGLGTCLHMAWDEFHTDYGHKCAMFSTRALQNCGFAMMHGARWDLGLMHIFTDNDPSEYYVDWLLDLWVKSRRVATEDSGCKDQLRPGDAFQTPDADTAKLLDRWEQGEWHFPGSGDLEWDEWWKHQTPKSKEEFATLSAEAVHSAPWWVLRNTGNTFEPELLEFSVSSPKENRDKLIMIASCVLALVEHSDGDQRVLYSLPFDVKPGSHAAQGHAERVLMRMYDVQRR